MIEQTLEKMRKMKLYGMVRSFKHVTQTPSMDQLTPDELIHLLVENEWDERKNRSMERSLRNARFRYKATIEGLDFHQERMLEKKSAAPTGRRRLHQKGREHTADRKYRNREKLPCLCAG